MNNALAVEGVSKRFGGFQAVDGLSFEAEHGRLTGFLGPNGAGKTTTLRMILGLVAPDQGRVVVLGSQDVRQVRDRVGFLPEERGLYRRMTPVDAIVFFAGLKGMAAGPAKRRALELLEANGLGHAARLQIRRLSKGMAQKVQLLSAIAHDPDLVILDEPFSGLDPLAQQTLEDLLRSLAARGAAVIFSTHVMQHAERLCERVVLIAGGRKVFDGSVPEARSAAPRMLVLEGAIPQTAAGQLPGLEAAAWEMDGAVARLSARLAKGTPVQAPLQAAFAQGWEISRFELKEPTLHDAFIRLAGGDAA